MLVGWGEALERKDPGTWTHCKRVAAFATVLARALKLDDEEVRAIACGALLHEIGKLDLRGHLKSGQWWSLQNRPTERGLGLGCFTPPPPVEASLFSCANFADRI